MIRKMSSDHLTSYPTVEALWGDTDWIDLAQDRYRWWPLVNAIMNLRVPYFLASCGTVSFLDSSLLHKFSYLVSYGGGKEARSV